MKRVVIILTLALILILGIMSSGTSSYFSDTENVNVTTCCWTTECEYNCGTHYIVLVDHSFDGTYSTWTYEVTSGSSPALSHWVLGWECDCSLIMDVYQLDENGDPIATTWTCGEDPTTGVTGIKVDNIYYDDGETRTVVFVFAGDYPLGYHITIGMKAGTITNVCEACGPVCEPACPYGSVILVSSAVSGLETLVTEAYTTFQNPSQPIQTVYSPYTPHYAVAAWEASTWNSSLLIEDPSGNLDEDGNPVYPGYTGQRYSHFSFSDGADWIWETNRTDAPSGWYGWPFQTYNYYYHNWVTTSSSETGRVVRFERTFEIPCSPRDAEMYITADNGYTIWINGVLFDCAQVNPCDGWQDYILTESYANSHGWETVEHYIIPASYLVEGTNTIVILAANEYMGTMDPDQTAGTYDTNPAGLIYWFKAEWGD